MRKVFNSDFRRKVKEIMAAALSICLVFGTLTIPVQVRAAGSDDFLTESKLTADMVLLPYDILQFDQDGDSYNRKSMVRIERYVDSTTYTGLNHCSYGAVPIEVDGNAYWHGFTVPEAPAGLPESWYVYVVQPEDLLKETVIWSSNGSIYYEVTEADASKYYSSDALIGKTVKVKPFPGFGVRFYDENGNRILSDQRFYVYRDGSTVITSGNDSGPHIVDNSKLGEVIGWSTNSDFVENSNSLHDLFFYASNFDGHFFFPDSPETVNATLSYVHNGYIDLYPVYKYLNTSISISSNGPYYEGTAPTFNVTSNNRTSEISYKYYKVVGDDLIELSAAPTTPGDYRVIASLENEPGDETYSINSDNLVIVDNRLYSGDEADLDFTKTLSSYTSSIQAPSANKLTYNGKAQALVTAGAASPGEMVYSVESDEAGFTSEIPMMMYPDTYKVWYKAVEDYRPDSEVGMVEVTIAPKTVGLTWSDTEFTYDGEEHCPSVTITGICGEDTCDVTVEGAAKEPGTYTAKVTGLSNSCYQLPSDATCEFTIKEPEVINEDPIITAKPAGRSLTYNGASHELITPGSVDGGDMLYSLSEDGEYSSVIPTAIEAGDYTVWYRVKGIEGVNDIEPISITATIAPKTVGLEWSGTEFTYDGEEHCPSVILTGLCGEDKCELTVEGAAKEVGTYTAKVTGLSNSNYTLPSNTTCEFTIVEEEVIIPEPVITTKPSALSLTYNGTSQKLISAGSAENGDMLYSLSKNGDYSSTIPSAKEAGDYTVWYMVKGTEGAIDLEPVSVTATIAPKTVGLKWSDTEFMYDGEEHCPKVELTGIISGDTCTVKVKGAQKEIGNYTATAYDLSNSNYELPGDYTKEFSILDPTKKKGVVTVSMKSYIYGGSASSPVISSKTNDVTKAVIQYKPSSSPDSAYVVSKPREVGNYTVKVTLPQNEEYNACSATAGFSISYLTVGNDAYSVKGTTGENGWYKSSLTITPGAGYELSYGDRNHFTDNPIQVADSLTSVSFYLRDANTGEQTDVISLNDLKIDSSAPQVVNLENSGIYYSNSGSVKCVVRDRNLDRVIMGGSEAALTQEGSDMAFFIPVGNRKNNVSFTVYDKAGNKTDFSVTTAPAWLEKGELVEGKWYLDSNESFTFPEGTKWRVNNGSTVYVGGSTFYVKESGEYTFTMD